MYISHHLLARKNKTKNSGWIEKKRGRASLRDESRESTDRKSVDLLERTRKRKGNRVRKKDER